MVEKTSEKLILEMNKDEVRIDLDYEGYLISYHHLDNYMVTSELFNLTTFFK